MLKIFKKPALALVGCLLTACQASPGPLPVSPRVAVANTSRPQARRTEESLYNGVVQLRRLRFDGWDTQPKDDTLTRNEVSDQNLKVPGLVSGFGDYDANRDGKIAFAEFLREDVVGLWMDIYADLTDNEFVARDLDRNHLLEGGELLELRTFFSRWPELHGGDLNQDGQIDYDEFQEAYMRIAPFLNRALPQ
ncbi:MAG: hypothetical protein ACO1RX_14325 [Candidatus Sericytochromatia bacterium]